MNEPPGARARVALTGLTVAEYFRDQEGQDVLLFIDNIFRFTQAGSEVRTVSMLFSFKPMLPGTTCNKWQFFPSSYFSGYFSFCSLFLVLNKRKSSAICRLPCLPG